MRTQSLVLSAIAAAVWISTPLSPRIRASEPPADAKTGAIVVRVIDGASAHQPTAFVSLFVFDNKSQLYKVACPDIKADGSGIAHFKRLSAENVYYVIRAKAAEGLVGYLGCTLDSKKARQEVNVAVLPSASGVLEVRDESGKPVSGASIWSITHNGPNGTMWFALGSLLKVCELSTTASDDRGELRLPELPAGKIDIKLIHPDFAPCELTGIPVDQRRNAVHAIMTRGITLTLRVNGDGKGPPVEGLSIVLDHEPYEHPSTISGRLPWLRTDGPAQFTVAAGKYTSFRLDHSDYFITPVYSMLRGHGIADEAECIELTPGNDHFTFQLHRKVKVRGRVLDASTGKPVAGQFVQAELPSNAGQASLARFAKKWSPAGSADTNGRGEFELDLAAGPARLTFEGHGFLSQLRHYPIDVAQDGSTVAPDILVRPVPKVRGVVQDQNGKPLPGAIVRFRGSLLSYACQPTVTDAQGRFELAPPWIPIDYQTEEPMPDEVVVACHPLDPLAAEARIDLREASGALDNVALRMKPQDYGQLVTGYPGDLTPWARGIIPPGQKDHLAAISLVGKPAPELDGAAWLNTDKPKMSLADFRGKYVLLQFWATWCGPCHREMPSVKLAYELYKDKGLVVIGVHDNSMPLDAIKDDVAKSGLSYPIVVDNPDGRIFATYREHGMADAYPTYALIDPDGNVLLDDATVAGPRLSTFKIEIIRKLLMTPQAGVGAALRIENGKVLITKIIPDSAAARTDDLHHDDQIIAVAEDHGEPVDVTGLALEKVVALIRGRNGTIVRLTVIPAGKQSSEARVISPTRGHVQTPFGGLGDGKLLSPGTAAPNFSFTRISDGKEYDLSHYQGKVVVLEVWASWCKPCVDQIGKFETLDEDHPDWKGQVDVLAVSIDEKREDASDCCKAHHWTKVPAVWSGPSLCDAFHINGVPTTYVIDQKGKVVTVNSELSIAEVIKQNHLLAGNGK